MPPAPWCCYPQLLLLGLSLLLEWISGSHAFVLPNPCRAQHRRFPAPRMITTTTSSSTAAEATGAYTWIGGYRIDLSEEDAPTAMPPSFDAAPYAPHPEGAPAPAAGAALRRMWRIHRLEEEGDGLGQGAGVAGVVDTSSKPFLVGDGGLLGEPEVCALILQTLAPTANPSTEGGEMVSWVDSRGRNLLPAGSPGLSRLLVHRLNILHKGAGIFVREDAGADARVFCHQRAGHKKIYPSMHDMFVGGVSLHGEGTEATARRELQEELGFGRPDAPFRFLYSCVVATTFNRCFVDVFEYCLQPGEAGSVKLDPEEVQWGAFVPLAEVKERVAKNAAPGEWTFVPDGLLVWDALVEHWARGGK